MANQDSPFTRSAGDERKRQYDNFAHAVTVIKEEHRLLHDGMVFYRTYSEADVPDGDFRVSLFRTGDRPAHFKRLTLSASEGPINISLAEDATVTTLGTVLETFNCNRISSNTPTATFYASDTVFADEGDPILGNLYIPASGNQGVTGETAALEELILKPNSDYSLSFQNDPAGGGTADINITFVWYEISYPD